MSKSKFSFLLFATFLTIISCDDEDSVVISESDLNVLDANGDTLVISNKDTIVIDTLSIKNISGDLSVRIIDDNGNPVAEQIVRLESLDSTIMDISSTDSNGFIDFGSWIEGNYRLCFDRIEGQNEYYFVCQGIQVLSGQSKDYEVSLSDFRSDIDLFFYDGGPDAPFEEGEALLFSTHLFLFQFETVEQARPFLAASGDINSEGRISLNVPIGEYIVLLLDAGEETVALDTINVSRGRINSFTVLNSEL